jgi:hypothetical protein
MSFGDVVEAIGPILASQEGATPQGGQVVFENALDTAAASTNFRTAGIEMQIMPPAQIDGMGQKLVDHLHAFYEQSRNWQATPPADTASVELASNSLTSPAGQDGGSAALDAGAAGGESVMPAISHATRMLERAFSFAIETTLISKAATESTRIFNTFLRGQ